MAERCDCADKPNATAQIVMLDMLVSRFCKALGEPVPEDAIRRAEQLVGAVEKLEHLLDRYYRDGNWPSTVAQQENVRHLVLEALYRLEGAA